MAIDYAAAAGTLSDSIVAVNASISTVGVLQEAAPRVLQPVRDLLAEAAAEFEAVAAAIDATIDAPSVGGVDGLPVPLMWGALSAIALGVEKEAMVIQARGYLGRVKKNVDREPS